MNTELEFTLPLGSRDFIRTTLITKFLEESPGTGNGKNASRYRYNVENYNNYRIYLKRPTQLNKGFDFTVNIDGLYFKKNRRYSNPSHNDIISALNYAKSHYPTKYASVSKLLKEIYDCSAVTINSTGAYFSAYDETLHPIEVILLAIKWLFIEQDCAYWNYSGRVMLYNELSKHSLV
ncbi:DNA adenine methylase [Lachnospiraceae bacterium OttesenSCG-928-J05]|nr:DNA adenine methylase [Lachnospiraceae bacterium OttesenSCG-928-J05]